MEKIIISTSFGLEALVKRQIHDLGYQDFEVFDGKIVLKGDFRDLGILNLYLREADRVYLELFSFRAETYEELFDGVRSFSWGDILAKDSNFIVSARTYKSKLFSLRSIQSVSEKAIVESLKEKYGLSFFEKTGSRVKIEIMLEDNLASVCLDTSGEGLHKRGYRQDSVKAPLRENLAMALVDLSFYRGDRFLCDGFCGSGTILIEAARRERKIPPGIDRDFDFENFIFLDKKVFSEIKKKALSEIDYDKDLHLLGTDTSKRAIELAQNNAANAGVLEDIKFMNQDFSRLSLEDSDNGLIISNPPYGKRLSRVDMDKIYDILNRKARRLPHRSFYLITGDGEIEKKFKRRYSKKRRLYNGGERVNFYQYPGEKLPQK